MNMNNVEETIDLTCEWIKRELGKNGITTKTSLLPEMIKALADLISARANSH